MQFCFKISRMMLIPVAVVAPPLPFLAFSRGFAVPGFKINYEPARETEVMAYQILSTTYWRAYPIPRERRLGRRNRVYETLRSFHRRKRNSVGDAWLPFTERTRRTTCTLFHF